MKLYSAGNYAEAIPTLEQEVEDGEVIARYSLGLAYLNGVEVEKDEEKAEILLTGAAVGGDPRAVGKIRELLEEDEKCKKDRTLRDHWGTLGLNKNLITGIYEFMNSPRDVLREMAAIYRDPCPGRPVQEEAAATLEAHSNGARRMWVYVP